MSNIPDNNHNVSLRLSKVLSDIGVNENMVIKRRRLCLLKESLRAISIQIIIGDCNIYQFGSQTESTTTLGLQSDFDILFTNNRYNVIQDWSEWEPGKWNLLMIQDQSVSPGYCLLQVLRDDAPLPQNYEVGQHYHTDSLGRILMKNSFSRIIGDNIIVPHGPAGTLQGSSGILAETDLVHAFPCKAWPVQADQLLYELNEGHWPTRDMLEYCRNSGCFVVGVGRSGSANEDLEWRISTSLTERCLMFNINITQIRCYVLMKMIMKTFISTRCPDSISSFMCKTVLLHCISNTRVNAWREDTLLTCLTLCLSTLYNCVLNEHCPHYFIPGNNLMAGRFSPDTKYIILENISYVVRSNGRALLQITCDDLGFRIQNNFISNIEIFPDAVSEIISGDILFNTICEIELTNHEICETDINIHGTHLLMLTLRNYMSTLLQMYDMKQGQDKIACSILARCLSITLGTVLASYNIHCQGAVRKEALTWMSYGINCDVASGKLKLASIFYCTGDIERTERVLKNIEESYDQTLVEPVCGCSNFPQFRLRSAFGKLCFEVKDEYTLLNRVGAPCVRFLRGEINCCPSELQHEMFRSTHDDLHLRSGNYYWMDWAVVDSLSYLYFLQYKVYSRLGRNEEKQRALSNLARCIVEEPNFGHRETALNLLGQCMEQENKIDAAFKCYLMSLKILERNNAANFHICNLLSSLITNRRQ